MKPHITEAMVDAHVAEQLEAQARRGVSLPIGLVRGLARTHLEMTTKSIPGPISAPRSAPAPPSPPPAPAPPQPVAPPPVQAASPAVVADRERAIALRAMTAKGAEAEAELQAAIAAGTSAEEYRSTVAARSILNAMRC